MKKLLPIIFLLWGIVAVAQVPPRPSPPRLVNDLAEIFTPQQRTALEQALVQFNDSTSNQIVVLTVNDLGGQEASAFAYEVGQQWGVGQRRFDNGVVILVKPKVGNSYGEVFIATGYGLEGALPDATCKLIVEREMIPRFRENDYFGGVVAALQVIMPIVKGEYSSSDYAEKEEGGALPFALLLVIIIVIVIAIGAASKNNRNGNGGGSGRSSLPWWLLLGGMSGGRSGGGFSSGGSGGFGGFGGGSFGGGGAGGRW